MGFTFLADGFEELDGSFGIGLVDVIANGF